MTDYETPAHFAAVDICNRFATMYVDVHCEAGPWGTKHLDDVTAIVQKAIADSCVETMARITLMAGLLNRTAHLSAGRVCFNRTMCDADCPACAWQKLKGAK